VRIELELERMQGTIGGTLAVDDALASEFYGWLELISRLEHASATVRTRGDPAARPKEAGR
jgi:hypothetical protein